MTAQHIERKSVRLRHRRNFLMWWVDPQGLLGPLRQDDDVKGGEPMTRGSSYLVDLQTEWFCVDPYLTWGILGKEPGGSGSWDHSSLSWAFMYPLYSSGLLESNLNEMWVIFFIILRSRSLEVWPNSSVHRYKGICSPSRRLLPACLGVVILTVFAVKAILFRPCFAFLLENQWIESDLTVVIQQTLV